MRPDRRARRPAGRVLCARPLAVSTGSCVALPLSTGASIRVEREGISRAHWPCARARARRKDRSMKIIDRLDCAVTRAQLAAMGTIRDASQYLRTDPDRSDPRRTEGPGGGRYHRRIRDRHHRRRRIRRPAHRRPQVRRGESGPRIPHPGGAQHAMTRSTREDTSPSNTPCASSPSP